MAATTLFVIVGTPYFAIDTVWLLATWAIYIVKKMAGMPSAITAWARNVWSTIQSRFLSLTNWIKNAWALLQHNLIQVVDFCGERLQSSSHYGWLVPILLIVVIFEPSLIFSDIIPSMKDTCSEWISCVVNLMITRSTTLMVWAKNIWTTMQSTMFCVSSLTGWVLGVVVLVIMSGARHGWLSLKMWVSSLTVSVFNTSGTRATAWARSSLSAAGSIKRWFTSLILETTDVLVSWFHTLTVTQTPEYTDDDSNISEIDDEEDWETCSDGNSDSGFSCISRKLNQCTKPIFQTIARWVLLMASFTLTPATTTESIWSTILQIVLKISFVADLLTTIDDPHSSFVTLP